MSGSSTTKSDSTTQNILPQWVQQAGQENYDLAKQVGNVPYNPAMNQNVAGLSDNQNAAIGGAAGLAGQGQAVTGQGIAGLQGLMGYQPQQVDASGVRAGQLSNTNLSPYMNPYTNDVIKSTMDQMNQGNAQALAANDSRAAAAGAFGGSRGAVQNAAQNAQNTMNQATMQSGLLSQNFQQAQGAAQQDIATRLQAGTTNAQLQQQAALANQQAGLQGAGLNLNAAGQLVGAGTTLQGQNTQDLNNLLQTGALAQTQNQNVLNAATANADKQNQYSLQGLNTRLSALGMTPYNTTQQTQGEQKTTQSNPLGAALGIAQMGASLFSDDAAKTDKTKIGKAPGTNLDMYAYRYKGDPKSYPKVVGLMASDVQKKVPGAVQRLPGKGGKRVVDYSAALQGG
jgi:hypothetical protein